MAVEDDVDLAVEGSDDVREAGATGRAEIYGAFERFVEKRGVGLGEAEDRAGRTFLAWGLPFVELNAGADVFDVGVVDKLGGGQRDLGAGNVGFTGLGGESGGEGRVTSLLGGPGELEGELGGEGQAGAVRNLVVPGQIGCPAFVAGQLGVDREVGAVGRVEREVRTVEVDQYRTHPQRDPAEDGRDRVSDSAQLRGDRI